MLAKGCFYFYFILFLSESAESGWHSLRGSAVTHRMTLSPHLDRRGPSKDGGLSSASKEASSSQLAVSGSFWNIQPSYCPNLTCSAARSVIPEDTRAWGWGHSCVCGAQGCGCVCQFSSGVSSAASASISIFIKYLFPTLYLQSVSVFRSEVSLL